MGVSPSWLLILDTVIVADPSDLAPLAASEARVLLLYSTREEAIRILAEAERLKLTGDNYLWIATQSVLGNRQEAPAQLPVGMLVIAPKIQINFALCLARSLKLKSSRGMAQESCTHGKTKPMGD
ncbi:Uncharacterized protein GBIM_11925 [Gryllus bimaculatus]|nr:Uncharacterized protein GBIM_11925 [Gryllus bimaculatus]